MVGIALVSSSILNAGIDFMRKPRDGFAQLDSEMRRTGL
jgi:hypothetical protein